MPPLGTRSFVLSVLRMTNKISSFEKRECPACHPFVSLEGKPEERRAGGSQRFIGPKGVASE
jgi:hypothetical protein